MIDTHIHLWNPAKLSYPWLDGIPDLNREFTYVDYQAAHQSKILKGVFIECAAARESTLAEADFVLDMASREDVIIDAVVASCWPEDNNFEKSLDSLLPNKYLRGIRRVLHTEEDSLSQIEVFRKNVASLARHQLSFDLCVLEKQLPLAIELVDACPDTMFILDHCGVPDIAADSPEFWKRHIQEISKRPNVVCKISGLLLYAKDGQRTAEQINPWFSYVIESFGVERCLWGGDWPVCTLAVPLLDWIEITHQLLDLNSIKNDERSAILQDNACRVYRIAN